MVPLVVEHKLLFRKFAILFAVVLFDLQHTTGNERPIVAVRLTRRRIDRSSSVLRRSISAVEIESIVNATSL
jgi:hypothetical protein